MKKFLKTVLSSIVIAGIFATSFIMPVSAEETNTSSDNTLTVLEKDLSTGETNEIPIENDDNSYGSIAESYIPETNVNEQQSDNDPNCIIGSDERKLVKNPDSRVAYIRCYYPDGSVCTGTAWIFANRALMTAGHCVCNYEYGGAATCIEIYPGYDETKGSSPMYYATAIVYGDKNWRNDDWGIIETSENLGNKYGYFGFTSSASTNDYTTLLGYHGDIQKQQQYIQSGRLINNISGTVISHKFDTYGGSSGSPLYKGDMIATGINVQENSYYKMNYARKIDNNLFNIMNTYRLNPNKIYYTVNYNANGGKGSMSSTKVAYNIGTNLRKNTFTKYGNQFAGWNAYRKSDNKWYYKNANGSSTGWYAAGKQPSGWTKFLYKDGTKVSKTTNVNNDVVTMYAQWKASTYTVKYNANGGTGSMSDTKVTYGVNTAIRANTFTKYGNQFVGWYAHRKADNSWYYKNPNGNGTGWYVQGKQPKGWVKALYKDKTVMAKTTGYHNDVVTMYAQWKASTYTVKYNANGGTGSMSDTKVTYGVDTAIRANTFTKYGNQFVGWYAYRKADNKWYYKNPNGSDTGWYVQGSQPKGWVKALYKDKAVMAKTTGYHNDVVTMYAQWKASTYTVKYNANGGTGSMSDTKVTYGVNTAIRANTFINGDKQFVGWYAYRKADNKWYYKNPNGNDTGWYVQGSQPKGWVKALYKDKVVIAKTTGYHNDVVTMYAQWK